MGLVQTISLRLTVGFLDLLMIMTWWLLRAFRIQLSALPSVNVLDMLNPFCAYSKDWPCPNTPDLNSHHMDISKMQSPWQPYNKNHTPTAMEDCAPRGNLPILCVLQSPWQPYNKNHTPTATEDTAPTVNLSSFLLHVPSMWSFARQILPTFLLLSFELWHLTVYSIHLTISNTFLHFISYYII